MVFRWGKRRWHLRRPVVGRGDVFEEGCRERICSGLRCTEAVRHRFREILLFCDCEKMCWREAMRNRDALSTAFHYCQPPQVSRLVRAGRPELKAEHHSEASEAYIRV